MNRKDRLRELMCSVRDLADDHGIEWVEEKLGIICAGQSSISDDREPDAPPVKYPPRSKKSAEKTSGLYIR